MQFLLSGIRLYEKTLRPRVYCRAAISKVQSCEVDGRRGFSPCVRWSVEGSRDNSLHHMHVKFELQHVEG